MRRSAFASLILLLAACATSTAATAQYWTQTFALSPATFKLPDNLPQEILDRIPKADNLQGTLRYRFAVSIGGQAVRVQLTNPFADRPMRVAGASVALAATELTAVPASLRRLTFGGQPAVTLPPGAPVLSDPVDLPVANLAELVVSLYLPEAVPGNPGGGASMVLTTDDTVMTPAPANTKNITGRPFISGVLVARARTTGVIVGFGDSITDGGRQKATAPHGWVAALARRLADQRGGLRHGVVSAGINGNRILSAGMGAAALTRADSDAFAVPGLTHLIVLEGINDIGTSGDSAFAKGQPMVTADALIAGLSQLAARAHARGVKIYAGTILPFRGAFYFAEDKEQIRLAVNAWIRQSKDFDGVIDFDRAMRDVTRPDALNPAYDSGDHLHPGDAGYQAMANAVPLTLFN